MTESQFQEARKIMQRANHMRGLITTAKGEVAKWTAIEATYIQQMKEGSAEGARKRTLIAIERLNDRRKKFEELKFPE